MSLFDRIAPKPLNEAFTLLPNGSKLWVSLGWGFKRQKWMFTTSSPRGAVYDSHARYATEEAAFKAGLASEGFKLVNGQIVPEKSKKPFKYEGLQEYAGVGGRVAGARLPFRPAITNIATAANVTKKRAEKIARLQASRAEAREQMRKIALESRTPLKTV